MSCVAVDCTHPTQPARRYRFLIGGEWVVARFCDWCVVPYRVDERKRDDVPA